MYKEQLILRGLKQFPGDVDQTQFYLLSESLFSLDPVMFLPSCLEDCYDVNKTGLNQTKLCNSPFSSKVKLLQLPQLSAQFCFFD